MTQTTTATLTFKQAEKIRRNNRRKNKVVEQFLKMIAKLQANLQALDDEQDAVNEAMLAALVQTDEAALINVSQLEAQIKRVKAQAKADKEVAKAKFGALATEAAEEAEAVRKIKTRLDALIS